MEKEIQPIEKMEKNHQKIEKIEKKATNKKNEKRRKNGFWIFEKKCLNMCQLICVKIESN